MAGPIIDHCQWQAPPLTIEGIGLWFYGWFCRVGRLRVLFRLSINGKLIGSYHWPLSMAGPTIDHCRWQAPPLIIEGIGSWFYGWFCFCRVGRLRVLFRLSINGKLIGWLGLEIGVRLLLTNILFLRIFLTVRHF